MFFLLWLDYLAKNKSKELQWQEKKRKKRRTKNCGIFGKGEYRCQHKNLDSTISLRSNWQPYYFPQSVTWPGRARRGNAPLKNCRLAPNNFIWNFFWLHLRLMYPQNVTICHNWGYKPKTFSALFARSIVLYPHFHSSGAVSDYNVSWVRWLVTIVPLKFLSRPQSA